MLVAFAVLLAAAPLVRCEEEEVQEQIVIEQEAAAEQPAAAGTPAAAGGYADLATDYLNKATEYAKPYVDQAYEAAAPYLDQAQVCACLRVGLPLSVRVGG